MLLQANEGDAVRFEVFEDGRVRADGFTLRTPGQSISFNEFDDNSDPISMRARHVANNESHLLVSIGDDPGTANDLLAVVTADNAYHHTFTVAGNAWHRNDLYTGRNVNVGNDLSVSSTLTIDGSSLYEGDDELST